MEKLSRRGSRARDSALSQPTRRGVGRGGQVGVDGLDGEIALAGHAEDASAAAWSRSSATPSAPSEAASALKSPVLAPMSRTRAGCEETRAWRTQASFCWDCSGV